MFRVRHTNNFNGIREFMYFRISFKLARSFAFAAMK
jgi:hypothetical protein